MNESFLSEALKFRISWQIHVSRWGRINFMMTSADDDAGKYFLWWIALMMEGVGGNQNNHIVGSISNFYVAMLLHDDIPLFNGHH